MLLGSWQASPKLSTTNKGIDIPVKAEITVINTLQELCGGDVRTRFAPSPTGHMHLGHAYSALSAWHAAGKREESFHLRIDDLDHTRCKPEFTAQIFDDLRWLGISWHEPVCYQSARAARYEERLATLQAGDFVYPCYLTRKEADSLLAAPHITEEGMTPAPSTRHLANKQESRKREASGMPPVWRLDSARAIRAVSPDAPLYWRDHEGKQHRVNIDAFGDVVLGRRDSPASYHLSTVSDDADSQINLVVRGQDLAPVTQIHRLLQALLGLPSPIYWHHQLICDVNGKRLAKRHDALSLKTLRKEGKTRASLIEFLPPLET